VVAALWLLIGKIREREIRWRATLLIGGAAAALAAVGSLLQFPLVLQQYPTSMPIEAFRAMMLLGIVLVAALGFVLMAGAAGLVSAFHPDMLAAFRAPGRRALALDALAAVAAAAGIGLAGRQLDLLLVSRFHAQALIGIDAPALIASKLPPLAAASGALEGVLLYAAGLTILALVTARRTALLGAAALLPFALVSSGIRTPGELALQYGVALVAVAAASAWCFGFARRNYLAYAVVFWAIAFRGPLGQLYGNTRPLDFWTTAAVLAAGVLWALLPAGRRANA
jgi:hypothetical protein